MRRVALLVGNSIFSPDAAIPNLRFPPADVEALASVLKEVGSFTRIEPLIEAGREQILTTLSTLLDEERGALVFFYYSGHGKISDSGRLILAARNTTDRHLSATGVPFASILEIKDDFSCSRFCAVLDCCYAGLGAPDIKGSEDEQLKAIANGRGIFFLGAANATTVAKEDAEMGHGVLTAAILEGLRTGEADVDNDGRITGPDLFTWCKGYAKSRNYHAPVHVTRAEIDDLVIGFSRRRLSQDTVERARAKLTVCWQHRLLDPSSLDQLHKYFMSEKHTAIPSVGSLAADFLAYVDGTLRLDEFWHRQAAKPPASPTPPDGEDREQLRFAKAAFQYETKEMPAVMGVDNSSTPDSNQKIGQESSPADDHLSKSEVTATQSADYVGAAPGDVAAIRLAIPEEPTRQQWSPRNLLIVVASIAALSLTGWVAHFLLFGSGPIEELGICLDTICGTAWDFTIYSAPKGTQPLVSYKMNFRPNRIVDWGSRGPYILSGSSIKFDVDFTHYAGTIQGQQMIGTAVNASGSWSWSAKKIVSRDVY